MNPTLHIPFKTRLTPCRNLNGSTLGENLFRLEITYMTHGLSQIYNAVYVPPALKVQFQNGPVRAIHLETLECNSKAMRALPNAPNYAVLGVEASDGRLFIEIPAEWRRLRRNLLLLGSALLLTSVAVLVRDAGVGLNFLAVGLFGLGTTKIEASTAVPRTPFTVFAILGDRSAKAITRTN
jgi:hypothetical protein